MSVHAFFFFFFFNDTATTELYTLSLHDALPISSPRSSVSRYASAASRTWTIGQRCAPSPTYAERQHRIRRCCFRSEEHTSELQSQFHLVCRLLLEKKKKKNILNTNFNIF